MITFIAILVTILMLAIAGGLVVLAGGAGLVLAFGDVIVCGLIIFGIIRLFMRKR